MSPKPYPVATIPIHSEEEQEKYSMCAEDAELVVQINDLIQTVKDVLHTLHSTGAIETLDKSADSVRKSLEKDMKIRPVLADAKNRFSVILSEFIVRKPGLASAATETKLRLVHSALWVD